MMQEQQRQHELETATSSQELELAATEAASTLEVVQAMLSAEQARTAALEARIISESAREDLQTSLAQQQVSQLY
jgi:hypothetical protein